MDNSRVKDLERFQKVIDNPAKHPFVKQAAHRAIKNIVKQMHDHRLTSMRHRLIKAAIANDELEQWKISNQIKEYAHEQKYDQQ